MELILAAHSVQKIGENSVGGALKQKTFTKKNQYGFLGRGIDWNHLFLSKINSYAQKSIHFSPNFCIL